MKKIALMLGVVAMVASATVPASADGYNQHRRHHNHGGNNDGALIIGGLIGGMLLGGAIANNNRGGYYQGGGYYVREEYYEPQCANRWVQIWDPYRGEWMHVKRVFCQ